MYSTLSLSVERMCKSMFMIKVQPLIDRALSGREKWVLATNSNKAPQTSEFYSHSYYHRHAVAYTSRLHAMPTLLQDTDRRGYDVRLRWLQDIPILRA